MTTRLRSDEEIMRNVFTFMVKRAEEQMLPTVSGSVRSRIFKAHKPICTKIYDHAIRSGFIVNGHKKQDWIE